MANPTHPGVEVVSKEFKHDDNDAVLCNTRVEIKFDGVTLDLAQSWEDGEELAPIFSGACWAGTVVWQAALDLCDYMSEHLRKELVGATVVELGCGIGVPGMVARILGARVVLTEQDELLSLLERNLDTNFQEGGRREGIRQEALDWERKEDTDRILASLQPKAVGRKAAAENLSDNPASIGRGGDSDSDIIRSVATAGSNEGQQDPREGVEKGRAGDGEEKAAGAVQRPDSSAPSIDGEGLLLGLQHNDAAAIDVEDGKTEATGGGAARRRNTRLDFLLCADCVFEPLYGDSWKALAKVMGRLSDAGTTVLCSVERRADDGVPQFLEACTSEGFALQMVFKAVKGSPSPVELYEFSKGGQEGFRGLAVEVGDDSAGVEMESVAVEVGDSAVVGSTE